MEKGLSSNQISVTPLTDSDSKARGSHTSTLFKDYILTIGGNEDQHAPCLVDNIQVLNIEKNTLQSVKPTNGILPARFDHSACLYKDNKIIIFGGYNEDSLNETIIVTITNTDPFSLEWKLVETQGGDKIHRYGHSANIYGDYMYVFGGMDQTEKSSNQLWKLDLNTFAWTLCQTTGDVPSERNDHSSVVYKDKLYIFGGFSFQKSTYMNDLWSLDLENMKWQQLTPGGSLPDARKDAPAQEENGKIYIFGGLQENKCTNDFFAYDIGNNTWEKMLLGENGLEARGAHTMVLYKDTFVIWGGFDIAYTGMTNICYVKCK